jgi:hypothetical protein
MIGPKSLMWVELTPHLPLEPGERKRRRGTPLNRTGQGMILIYTYRLGDRDRLARPVDDALFFAGEAAHNGEREREVQH